ncbi:putative MFS family arabinose efflux permease [Bradyrhizobium japonicum]
MPKRCARSRWRPSYEPTRTPSPRRHPFQDIREGAAFVFHHPLLRPVFITQFIFNTGWFLQIAVFVPYAVRHLGLTAAGVGTVLTMYGVGMVIGALFATRVMKRIAFGTVVGLGPVTGFAAAVVMALTVLVPSPWLAALSFFLLGVGPILWVISTTTLRQSVTPPRLLGRVSAINIMSYGARPLGSALGAIVGGPLERGSLPVSRRRRVRRAGAGDLALSRRGAGSAAGHGGG